jgi:AraC-like DNA-binding protein
MVSFRRYLPARPLQPFISSYYVVEADPPAGTILRDVLVPELANVRFQLEGAWVAQQANTRWQLRRAMLTGFTHQPIEVFTTGRVRLFGAGIQPLGWRTLFRFDAREAADMVLDLKEVMPADQVRSWKDRLLAAKDDAEMVAATDHLFFAQLSARLIEQDPATRAIESMLLQGARSVDAIAAGLAVSNRQAERLVGRAFGCPPKMLLRKTRFVNTMVRLMSDPDAGWIDLADDGYYDQSHFIKDFKAFSGRTPKQFRTERRALIEAAIESTRNLALAGPGETSALNVYRLLSAQAGKAETSAKAA